MWVVSLELSIEVTESLVLLQEDLAEPFRLLGIDAAMVPADRLRLVLHCIRGGEDGALLPLREGLRAVASSCTSFSLTTAGTRFLPDEDTGRLLAVGHTDGTNRASALARQVAALTDRLGLPSSESEWANWVQLARVRTPRDRALLAGVVRSYSETTFGVSQVKGLVLERHALKRGRATRATVERFPLDARVPLPA
mgnify:CR=1 FL=1